jgi:hypothetical protein
VLQRDAKRRHHLQGDPKSGGGHGRSVQEGRVLVGYNLKGARARETQSYQVAIWPPPFCRAYEKYKYEKYKHATDLATNARLLENVHGLRHDGTLHAEALRNGPNTAVKRAPPESGVFDMQRVAQLVERALLWHHNLAVVVYSAGLEEIADLGAGMKQSSVMISGCV